MKTLLFSGMFSLLLMQANSQVTRKTATKIKTDTTTKTSRISKPVTREASTERGLDNTRSATTITTRKTGTAEKNESPFAGGIHPAPDADKPFDSAQGTSTSNINSVTTLTTTGDTTHNVHTEVNNGVNTTSGAVDRSGQAQFGQSNWGRNERNTVGESQWTIPPPVTSSFRKEFPEAASTTWRKNLTDSTLYFARYRSGANWAYSTYNASGERVSTHIEIPLVQAPRAVSLYLAKQPADLRLNSIARLQMPGKPEVYEIKTSSGKTIYVNDDGVEVRL